MRNTHKWTTRTAIAVSVAALAAGLTACGSDSDSKTDAGKSVASPSATGPSVTQPPLATPPSDELEQKSGGNISQGARGFRVNCVQWGVDNFNPASYQVSQDGIFGPKTARAVRKYQSTHGLSADGIVGPRTANKLRAGMRARADIGVNNRWLRVCSSLLPS